jgi:hypothetical protein
MLHRFVGIRMIRELQWPGLTDGKRMGKLMRNGTDSRFWALVLALAVVAFAGVGIAQIRPLSIMPAAPMNAGASRATPTTPVRPPPVSPALP